MLDIFGVHGVIVALVALIVIGPKDLPKTMRVLGYWVGRARGVARQFRAGFDEMVREAELAEMEKKWAAENERIMQEHGAGASAEAPAPDPLVTAGGEAVEAAEPHSVASPTDAAAPAIVDEPALAPSRTDGASALAKSRASRGGPRSAGAPVTVEQPQVAPAPAGVDAPPVDPAAS